jgi:hypothetical protein
MGNPFVATAMFTVLLAGAGVIEGCPGSGTASLALLDATAPDAAGGEATDEAAAREIAGEALAGADAPAGDPAATVDLAGLPKCTTSADCSPGELCCATAAGDVCATVAICTGQITPQACTSDADCSGGQICCAAAGGRQCSTAAACEKGGDGAGPDPGGEAIVPDTGIPDGAADGTPPAQCSGDSDCLNGHVCCATDAGRTCVVAGTCQAGGGTVPCSADSDCLADQVCCAGDAGLECMTAARCIAGGHTAACTTDVECGVGLVCCHGDAGSECMGAQRCQAGGGTASCATNAECGPGMLCCAGDAGRECFRGQRCPGGGGGPEELPPPDASPDVPADAPATGDFGPPGQQACDACAYDLCASQVDQCYNVDAECSAMDDCVGANCDSAATTAQFDQCVQQCASQHPTGAADWNAMNDCLDARCAAPCDF